jgi:hypothetical protein
MLYAKLLSCGIEDFHHAGIENIIVCGDKLEFTHDIEGKPLLRVTTAQRAVDLPIFGDVFIMSESGKTLSQYAVNDKYCGRGSEGWRGDSRVAQ